MRVFYRGPGAVITAEVFTAVHSARRAFVLADLSAVHIVRQQGPRGLGERRTMGVSALVGSTLVIPVVGRASILLATVAVTVLVVYAIVSLRLGPPAHNDLVATYRGRRVILFSSDDQREFDQLCRGMQRALEHRR